jgi:signal transduction histidine kinase
MSHRLRLDAPWLDLAAAAALTAGAIAEVLSTDAPAAVGVPMALALGALVAVRRRVRVTAAYGFAAWAVAMALAVTSPSGMRVAIFALLLFPYAVGAGVRGWPSYAYVPVLFAVIGLSNLQADMHSASDWIFPTALALAAYAAGRNALHRTALAVELHEAALRAGEERDAQARLAVAAERRRIAHEMHDVVGHSISVMVVQAGGARRILERDPERAEQAAAHIERTGRETLLEMRRLLGVMRDPRTAAVREPNPTLDGLDSLVAGAREAGLPVRLRVEGERRQLGQGLELGAYRVVQDALDEVLRVAPGSETEVVVTWGADALGITVADDRPSVPFADGAGPSLVGVRERVALYGGELRTGQRPDGGHEVHVRFPLTSQPDPVPAQGAA